jgi:uncharacterized membrane protein YfcA
VLQSLAGIGVTELLLIWGVTLVAVLLRSFTGFGFALAAVPGYALFMEPVQAVVLCAGLAVALGIQTLPQYIQQSQLRAQWRVYAAAPLGTAIGIVVLRSFDADTFRISIGVITIVASLVLVRFHPRRRSPAGGTQLSAGLCSGLINGGFAIPGPPIIIYIMATEVEPTRSRAFMIAFFSFSAVVALIGFTFAGLVSMQSAWLALAAYPALYLGDKLGFGLFRRYGGGRYRQVAVAALLLMGLVILLKGLL